MFVPTSDVQRETQTGEWVTDSDENDLTMLELQPHLETLTTAGPVFGTPHLLNPV